MSTSSVAQIAAGTKESTKPAASVTARG
jgi:hypothetical protein